MKFQIDKVTKKSGQESFTLYELKETCRVFDPLSKKEIVLAFPVQEKVLLGHGYETQKDAEQDAKFIANSQPSEIKSVRVFDL